MSDKPEPTSIEFMLAEFSHLGELWRHTDSRIETAVNIYLTTAAVFVPGVLLAREAFPDLNVFLGVAISVALAFAVMGVFITARIRRAHEIKVEYIMGLNLVRKYFVDRDALLNAYLLFPVTKGSTRSEYVKTTWLRRFAAAVAAINCAMVGFASGATSWLLGVREVAGFLAISLAGAIVVASSWIWFSRKEGATHRRLTETPNTVGRTDG